MCVDSTSVIPCPFAVSQWMCQFCTFVNTKPTPVCEMCNLSGKDSGGVSLPQSLQQTPPSATRQPPQPRPRINLELKRQKTMREDGLKLIHQIRVGQRQKHLFFLKKASGKKSDKSDCLVYNHQQNYPQNIQMFDNLSCKQICRSISMKLINSKGD